MAGECAAAIARGTGLPVLGALPRDAALAMPERHLGLVPAAESGTPDFLAAAAKAVGTRIDVDRILTLAGEYHVPEIRLAAQANRREQRVVIAVARDEAFHFCYEENLTLLEEAGAKLAFFSPLKDESLPANGAGVLLSGGFPEIFAEPLAANGCMHAALRTAHARGLPIYAECGGLMYLTEAIADFEGRTLADGRLAAGPIGDDAAA